MKPTKPWNIADERRQLESFKIRANVLHQYSDNPNEFDYLVRLCEQKIWLLEFVERRSKQIKRGSASDLTRRKKTMAKTAH